MAPPDDNPSDGPSADEPEGEPVRGPADRDATVRDPAVRDPGAPDQVTTLRARRTGRRIMAKTEQLADAAIDLIKREAHLPSIQEEASRVAAFWSSIHSRVLALALALYVATALTGVGVAVTQGIHDWFMHLAMYVVILSFLVIYVKQHLMFRRLPRAFYAVSTTALMAFFAWVLMDLVGARQIAHGGQAVLRPAVPLLRVPAFMLLGSAATLLLHWLVLSRMRNRAT